MGVEVTGIDEAFNEIQKAVRKLDTEIITRLSYIGQKVVDGIRDGSLSDWNDHTGNLRSSIGYCVLANGSVVERQGFQVVLEGQQGSINGSAFLDSLVASADTKGYVLIIVAGMNYASYVEDIYGKPVLALGRLEAERMIAEMIQTLNR